MNRTIVSHCARIVGVGLWAGCAAGCAAGSGASGQGGAGETGGAGGAKGSPTASNAASGFGTSSTSTGGGGALVLYAHTNKTLFQIDPASSVPAPVVIGDFDCIGGSGQSSSMTDIAVNAAGDLWGITEKSVIHLTIQGSTVHCTSETPLNAGPGVKFYGLSFAPVGVLDPQNEVLVAGNTAGELWSIDANGNITQRGTLGAIPKNDGHGHTYASSHQGKPWELSGDIVFLANGGALLGFATVRDCPTPPSTSNCNKTDTLIEVDVAKLGSATTQSVTQSVRGEVVKRNGCADAGNASGYGSMFGIAAVNDKVYGFSHAGAVVEINNIDGSACLLADTPSSLWDGAGVTTLAPVVPPPN